MIDHPGLFYLALLTLPFLLLISMDLLVGAQSLKYLDQIPPAPMANLPALSVVVAARNEEAKIQAALQSLLAQDYSRLEVIVIDDRSSDATGAILDRMSLTNPHLRVFHVSHLPPGWLGKNHALYFGAERASGELLLFTDADVMMAPTSLRRAVCYLNEYSLDHLAVAPQVRVPGVILNIFVAGFTVFFSLFARPWKARDPRSPRHIGIGAFNLIRARAYQMIGTHQAISLRPDDDLKLGKLLKKHGLRQDMALGPGLIWVEWYSSVRELIQGLMKNMFSGFDYRLPLVPIATLLNFLLFVWPALGILLTSGQTRWLNSTLLAISIITGVHHVLRFRGNPFYAIGLPLASALFIYIIWKATLTTLINGGINWRGTHYSLEELKGNKV
jgi:cellulose synthase/poly-beta-1,6-N-acetylglucosamine synthase-like glycosyltransferase